MVSISWASVCEQKNEKHVVLTLLEVARRGAKLGMLAPMLVQFEQQIDIELARWAETEHCQEVLLLEINQSKAMMLKCGVHVWWLTLRTVCNATKQTHPPHKWTFFCLLIFANTERETVWKRAPCYLLTLIRVASQPTLKEWLVTQCHVFGTVKNGKSAWLWELGWGTSKT